VEGEPAFLVVEDDPRAQLSLRRIVQRYGRCVVVATCAEARQLLQERRWTGFIIDVGLPDGNGLELLEDIREVDGWAPALVITGTPDDERRARAFRKRAWFWVKGPDFDEVSVFLAGSIRERRAAALLEEAQRREAEAQRLIELYSLTGAEAQLLRVFLGGVPRSELAHAVGVCENTVKAHAKSILAKCEARSFDGLRRRVTPQAEDS